MTRPNSAAVSNSKVVARTSGSTRGVPGPSGRSPAWISFVAKPVSLRVVSLIDPEPRGERNERRRREAEPGRAGPVAVDHVVSDVQRATGRHAEPSEREVEGGGVGLRRARLGRGDDGVEESGEPGPLQVRGQCDVPVGDAGEAEAGRRSLARTSGVPSMGRNTIASRKSPTNASASRETPRAARNTATASRRSRAREGLSRPSCDRGT